MCGILGYFQSKRANQVVVPFHEGLDCLIHRGPDDKGSNAIEFPDLQSTLILGQTRLSIIDLSSSGDEYLNINFNKLKSTLKLNEFLM